MTAKELIKAAQEKAQEDKRNGLPAPRSAEISLWSKEQTEAYVLRGEIPRRGDGLDPLAKVILDAILPYLPPQGIDEDEVRKIVETYRPAATEIVVKTIKGEVVNVGATHKEFPKILALMGMLQGENERLSFWFAGPTGSGKSHLCHQLAKAAPRKDGGAGVKFWCQSMGPQTTQSQLIGYMSATGEFVPTPLYHAMRDGGFLLWDEGDAANPGVAVIANAIASNRWYVFPNGERVEASPDFWLAVGANTWGNGGDREYVGRAPQDKSLLARFLMYPIDYDEALEVAFCGDTPATRAVQEIRRKALQMKEKVIASPRQSKFVNMTVAAGFTLEEALDLAIWNNTNPEVKARIISARR